jgi:hypothetical protein
VFKWIGKRVTTGAVEKAVEFILSPPKKLVGAWEGIPDEDKERIKNVIRTTADLYIKYGSKAAHGKVEF